MSSWNNYPSFAEHVYQCEHVSIWILWLVLEPCFVLFIGNIHFYSPSQLLLYYEERRQMLWLVSGEETYLGHLKLPICDLFIWDHVILIKFCSSYLLYSLKQWSESGNCLWDIYILCDNYAKNVTWQGLHNELVLTLHNEETKHMVKIHGLNIFLSSKIFKPVESCFLLSCIHYHNPEQYY